MTKPTTYERKGTVDSHNVDIVNSVQSVADATDAKGIEIDTDRVISTDAFDEQTATPPDAVTIDVEPMDPIESKSADLIAAIGEMFQSKLGGDADEIAKSLKGQDLASMSYDALVTLHGDLAAM